MSVGDNPDCHPKAVQNAMSSGMAAKNFQVGELRDAAVLGAVGSRSARVWLRADLPGEVWVTWGHAGENLPVGELVAEVRGDDGSDQTEVVTLGGLEPTTRYWFRINRRMNGGLVGEGSFETAPEGRSVGAGKFSIGLASCHQPFDGDGAVRPGAREMLRAARAVFREENTKLAFFAGDQMYSDKPEGFSLFDDQFFRERGPEGRRRLLDCSVEELRRLYQQRYRTFFNLPEWIALQAETPCYPTWDDHELVDNWGSDPMHQQPDWVRVGEGARRACHDYQMSRVMSWRADRAFHYVVEHGPTATFVADMRTERRTGENGRLFSEGQRADFEAFLESQADRAALFVVLGVPPVHLPRKLSRGLSWMAPSGNDFDDRWSTGAHVRDRDWFLRTVYAHQVAHPGQHVTILAGDIHIGCAHAVRWDKPKGLVLHQLISSGITHRAGALVATASKWLMAANRTADTENGDLRGKVRLLEGVDNHEENPLGELNLGIVEVETLSDGQVDLRFKLYGHRKGEPVCKFESEVVRG